MPTAELREHRDHARNGTGHELDEPMILDPKRRVGLEALDDG